MASLLWFDQIGIDQVDIVGGKNASLGEMINSLADEGIRIPAGFATTSGAYRDFLRDNDLDRPIRRILDDLRRDATTLARAGRNIRNLILKGRFSTQFEADLAAGYDQLAAMSGVRNPAVAVRSSATAEDLANASFAGQQDTFLNVRGKKALFEACRRCFASLFTDRAISYRALKGFEGLDVALSVGVQQMVRSDRGGSGVIFTIDTESGFPDVVTMSAAWGLGETVVRGIVDPDQYMIFKPLLGVAPSPIIGKKLGAKACKAVDGGGGEEPTRIVDTSPRERKAFVLTEAEALELARWAVRIEQHYGRPMDIEWAKDGVTGELFILQARPETVHAIRQGASFDIYRLKETSEALTSGAAVGGAIAAGEACLVRRRSDLDRFRDGQIIVASVTSPDWLPVLKRASGIVTEHGGTTSHAAIVSRELGLPAVVGTGDAMSVISNGQNITVSCAEGDKGIVYKGWLGFERQTLDVSTLPFTRTALMVNLANPDAAFQWWRLPARGVGLARIEFIIGSLIKAHPMALAHPERLSREDLRKIRALTAGYATPTDYFVDILSLGIARLAAPYHPEPAIVRLSDFKTNEYAGLIGGHIFEPTEENPMLGFRGASRYYHDNYRDGFALECLALKRAREELGFTNIIVMIPFCRTLAEADLVLETMAAHGLRRGEAGLQVYMMCEIPSNIILGEAFAERFDGFSIGSNDLTQLILGVDRDSEILSPLFDEKDRAVTMMIEQAVGTARKAGIKIGLCGQAPSDHPEFAEFLVATGIDSISLNPDSFVRTIGYVAGAEEERQISPQNAA